VKAKRYLPSEWMWLVLMALRSGSSRAADADARMSAAMAATRLPANQ